MGVLPRTFIYDSLSRLTSATNPESGTIMYKYDADSACAMPNSFAGLLVSKLDARNIRTCMQYDVLNRSTQKNYSDGTPAANFLYDASTVTGLGTTLTNPVGRLIQASTGNTRTVSSYDSAGRPANQWQCTPQNCGIGWFPFAYVYDLAGDPTSASNGVGTVLTSAYNAAAQLTSMTSSLADANHPGTLVSGMTYSPLGTVTSATLGNGLNESLTYANRGWLQSGSLSSTSGGTATPGTGSVTIAGSETSVQTIGNAGTGTVTISGGPDRSTSYNACPPRSCPVNIYDGGPITVTVNGVTAGSTSYGSASTSSSLASALASNINGNGSSPVTATANGSIVTLVAKTTGSSTNYSFSASSVTGNTTYFPAGSTSFPVSTSGPTLTGGTNAVTTYDTGTVSIIVNSFTASYTYGQNDTVSSIASGLVSSLAPSSVNASASGGVITLTAKVTGAATNYPLSVSVSYDTAHFSSASFTATRSGPTLTGGADNAPYQFNLTYAPDGDVLSANDTVNGNWTYGYDPFNRLIGSNKNSGQQTYSYVYDRFGNRWQQNAPQGGNQFIATFTGNNPGNPQNSNRMDGYSYDASGNLLNDGSHTYFYDAESRITQVGGTLGTCSTATACYVYDANGQRIRKTTGGTSVDYLYDLSGHEVAEVSSAGLWNRGEVYVDGKHLATYFGGTTYFNHADWLGTQRMRTNMSAASCETVASLPFGDGQTTSGSCGDPSPMHFTGKERDSESGLDDFEARYYSSSLGRFVIPDWSASPEPIPYAHVADPQSLNLYSYIMNNPLSSVDKDGHCRVCPDGMSPEAKQRIDKADGKTMTIALLMGAGAALAPLAAEGGAVGGALTYGRGLVTTAISYFLTPRGQQNAVNLTQAIGDYVTGSVSPVSAVQVGDAREAAVAASVGGKIVNMKVFGASTSTEVDVLSKAGEYIGVGGAAKASNLADFGQKLSALKEAAGKAGTIAKYYLEAGTSQDAINLAKRILGENSVIVFKIVNKGKRP